MNVLVDMGLTDGVRPDWDKISNSLKALSDVTRRELLEPVPCIEQANFFAAREAPEMRGPKRQLIERTLSQLVCWEIPSSLCEAKIVDGPRDLGPLWMQCLRESLSGTDDWRSPQILVVNERRSSWPMSHTVGLLAEACSDLVAIAQRDVPLIHIDEYAEHPYARSDRDPWDLRAHHPPQQEAASHQNQPCILPKPPECIAVEVIDLTEKLKACSSSMTGECCYYIPPNDWDPLTISSTQWRNGRAFPNGVTDHNRSGPKDCDGRVWQWDRTERHWDVQFGDDPHIKINHEGRRSN